MRACAVLLVCLAVASLAQILPYPEIGDLRGLDETVEATQYFYNRNFDEAIRESGRAQDAALRTASLANVQSVFCPTGFQGWTAYSPNADGSVSPLVAPNTTAVASLYQYLAGSVFVNFSSHVITNVEVDIYRVNLSVYANLTASITQTAITVIPGGAVMTTNYGRYHNTYKLNGMRFCMLRFEANTFVNFVLLGVPTAPVNFITGHY